MSKTYKGYELIKAIADGEIKEGSKFKCILGISNKGFKQEEIYMYEKGKLVTYRNLRTNKMDISCDYSLKQLAEGTFELIEEEIDIQKIEECEWMTATDRNFMINKLIKAVKQLDKKIKEKE